MTMFCFLRNVHDIRPSGVTAYKARYGQDFDGPIVPFGVGVHYKPSRQKDIDATPKFVSKVNEGIMVGYHQNLGGGWSGDVEVIDAFELTHAGEISGAHCKRVHSSEITIQKHPDGKFMFPVTEQAWEQPLDNYKMTRRIRKGKKIKISRVGSDGQTLPTEKEEVRDEP